ncbi:DUF4136 domain-containing protein [Verrucomicrobia bacterium S94]|nr:DUF4136 domain-containing protein [Verrucomicrobia bacterium S94]
MNRFSFLYLGTSALLSGCSSISVSRDYDVAFDFSRLKTFAWQHAKQPETGVTRVDNDLNDRRIRAAINAELKAKGFSLVENREDASFLVAYYIDFQQRIEGRGTFSIGLGRSASARGGAVGWSSGTNISDYEEAHLTIDFIDPETGLTVWRGWGRRRASNSGDPDKITKKNSDTVGRILKRFPPKQKER